MLRLTIRDLEMSFQGLGRPALALSALEIAPTEKVAVTGPSGCGKTTFLNVVTGLDRVRKGSVRWGETDLSGLSEAGRDRWRAMHVGLVMQEIHLFPGLSALDNVLLPSRLSRLRSNTDFRAGGMQLLELVDIDRPDQPVETMSRGQMQRIAVARALVGRPAIIVADEPTASLDADSGASVADLLLRLSNQAGATLIVASHQKRLIEGLDHVIHLESGAVVSDTGKPAATHDEAFL
ncbi:ATP-binding cassette domain-containing protein [Mesorhizobium sp. M0767]|uniref:ABC transporter ATP-binding protein n=1 Tax=Mesorhizobium sp. M0767 TaxID=2956995 RepID=UPI00333B75B6